MHLVVVTSVIRPRNAPSVFSENERFEQLLESVRCVSRRVPDAFVVVIEGSAYAEEQAQKVKECGAHRLVHIDVDRLDKQYGECTSLATFFLSEEFRSLHERHAFRSIHKLSGRYILTDFFQFHYDGETCVGKIVEPADSYSGHGMVLTRYYSIPIKYLDHYVRGLVQCCRRIFVNVEHSFYLYQVIPLAKIRRDLQTIHVAGHIAPNGEYVED